MRGMTIGIFNHAMHDDIDEKPTKCEVLPDGTLVAPFELESVTIFSSRKFSFKPSFLQNRRVIRLFYVSLYCKSQTGDIKARSYHETESHNIRKP